MKKQMFLIVFSLFYFSCSTSIRGNINTKSNNTGDMIFSISKVVNNAKTNETFIELEFKNINSDKIRLLGVFEPFQIFFTVKVIQEDGNEITLPGAGKVSLSEQELSSYIIISKGKSYKKVINLDEVLKEYSIFLKTGFYKLKISYHNQYGTDCIKGRYDSNEIQFNIK